MSAWQFVGLGLLTTGAAIVQTATGFGFAAISAPLYVLALGPVVGIQATIIVTAVISLVVLPSVRQIICMPLLVRLAIGSLVGLPVGVLGFRGLAPSMIREVVGASTFVFSAALLVANNTFLRSRRGGDAQSCSTRSGADFASGVISGITTALVGVSGPPIMIYLILARVDKEVIRATLLAFFAFVYVATLIVHAASVGVAPSTYGLAAGMTPFAVVGSFMGTTITGNLSQRVFENSVLVVLLAVGVVMLTSG
jgi:uncharacterized membrane protein YfcA